jgi:hypothetical protein
MRAVIAATCITFLWGLPSNAVAGSDPIDDATSNRILTMINDRAVPAGLGVNVHFTDGHESDLDLIKAMGFRLVRTDVLWSEVERARGHYDWGPYDALIGNAYRRGLTPLLILAYSNPLYASQWKGGRGRLDWAYEPPITISARNAFVAFARAAAERYRGRVIWEIWNEPNQTFGKPARLDAYMALAAEACRAMRAVNPDAAIIGPASAGFAMKFLEDFIRNDTEDCFDGVSVHPYRDWDPDSAFIDWHRLHAAIARGRHRRTKLAIDSEWGYSVQSGPWTEQRQAEYVMRLYLTDLLADVAITIIYDWRNDGLDPHDKEQNFGLLDFYGKPKPVADALIAMIRALDGSTALGKIKASARAAAVAFGTPNGPLKIAAWSVDSTPMELVLGPTLCLDTPESTRHACASGGARIQIDPIRLSVSGKPVVVEATVKSCSTASNATATFASWCDSRPPTVP